MSKSPIYGGWNDASAGGDFGPSIKAAGYDGVFVNGISKTPVYIFIDSGKAEIRDAENYWGLTCSEFEDALNEDPEALIAMNHMCNEAGLDTIHVGGTLAWALECFNEGVLTKEDLDGIAPTYGDAAAAVALTKKICDMEGCGEILSQGSQKAADHYGKGHSFLFVASGVEIAAHDPRRAPGYIRTYQLDPTPGRHTKGGLAKANDRMTKELRFDYRVTGHHDVQEMCITEYINASGLCIFTARVFPGNTIYDAYKFITGNDIGMRELRFFGMRSFTMRWAFNLREGLRREDFTVTDRMCGRPPLKGGPTAGVTLDEERLGDNFYNALGYYQNGTPYLDMLLLTGGLECVIGDLYPPEEKR